MKQIITSLVICLSITTVHASQYSLNPVIESKSHSIYSVFKDHNHNALRIIPNAKTGDIQVSFSAEKAGKATIVVLNESGNTVLTQKVQLVAGKNCFNVNNFNNLSEGDYTVCLNTHYGAFSSPFLLWK